LAELDAEIERPLHDRRARVTEDRPGTQGARTEFHPALEPADRGTAGEIARGCIQHRSFFERVEAGAGAAQLRLDLFLAEARAKIGAGHPVAGVAREARTPRVPVVGG